MEYIAAFKRKRVLLAQYEIRRFGGWLSIREHSRKKAAKYPIFPYTLHRSRSKKLTKMSKASSSSLLGSFPTVLHLLSESEFTSAPGNSRLRYPRSEILNQRREQRGTRYEANANITGDTAIDGR